MAPRIEIVPSALVTILAGPVSAAELEVAIPVPPIPIAAEDIAPIFVVIASAALLPEPTAKVKLALSVWAEAAAASEPAEPFRRP
jgi:hypothetical protein